MDLGADLWQTFRFVTFPSIRTALLAGALLAFALSFDEIDRHDVHGGRGADAADLDLHEPVAPEPASDRERRRARSSSSCRSSPSTSPQRLTATARAHRRRRGARRPDGGGTLSSTDAPAPGFPVRMEGAPGEKGLKGGALGFALGRRDRRRLDRARLQPRRRARLRRRRRSAFEAPAIMLVAFVPMLFIAASYYYLNRADPDCGTTFSWATRALGPWVGWLGGWAIIVADIIVMANLAAIAGIYTFELFGADEATAKYAGARRRRRLDRGHDLDLLHRDRGLGAHPVGPARRRDRDAAALRGGGVLQGLRAGDFADSVDPSLSWLNPFDDRLRQRLRRPG